MIESWQDLLDELNKLTHAELAQKIALCVMVIDDERQPMPLVFEKCYIENNCVIQLPMEHSKFLFRGSQYRPTRAEFKRFRIDGSKIKFHVADLEEDAS